jgi:hypothetical protein
MDANEGLTGVAEINRIHRAGLGAVTAANTPAFFNDDAAAIALGIRVGGTGSGTGCRIAGKAGSRFKTGGQTSGGHNADACRQPGQPFVDYSSARQGAGIAADAAFHSRGG